MIDSELSQITTDESRQTQFIGFLWQNFPYIAVLVLAIFGVAYTNITQQHLIGYWEFLALAVGVVCVITRWSATEPGEGRRRLILTQVLHWATFLITMNIVLLPGVQKMLPTPATSLVLLMLLALGTFLAGVNLWSLPISFLGLLMAFAVPAIAWLKQSALFLVLAAMLFIGLGMLFWRYQKGERNAATFES
ncbi:MAG TPA: hypothetical protein VHE81_02575 [Lacipirellulaceae bacterium]|nr:hypothetical protein [Lacipirellulaceae bacterium]